jgi:hypothetical protein
VGMKGVSVRERASELALGRIRLRYGVEWTPRFAARDDGPAEMLAVALSIDVGKPA